MIKQILIPMSFILLLSGCKSVSKIKDVELGTSSKEVLFQYGAPEKVQKLLEFEVWSYQDQNPFRTENCLFFFKKNKLSEPVKCFVNRREPASKKVE